MTSTKLETNWSYLLPLVGTLTLGCANVGFVIVGNNTVGGILSQKADWGSNEDAYNTAISSSGVSGLIIGSFAIEPLLKKIGRRKAIMLTSFLSIPAVIPTIIVNIFSICIGKFFFGLTAGSLIVASSIYLNETVPVEHASTFGFTTNFGVIIGIMTCLLMGAGLPDPNDDPQAAKDNTYWMVISLFPAGIGALNLLLWLCFFKLESLKCCLASENGEDEARQNVRKIYKAENEEAYE